MDRTTADKTTARRKQVIQTAKASAAIGPYSQGIKANGFVFIAAKGVDPKTDMMVPGGLGAETRQTLENIKAILEAAGSSRDLCVSALVHLTDLDEFARMNKVFVEYFKVGPPSRTTVEVPALPAGAHVEITVVALAGE